MGEVSDEYLKDFACPIFLVGNQCCIAFISVLLLARKNKGERHKERSTRTNMRKHQTMKKQPVLEEPSLLPFLEQNPESCSKIVMLLILLIGLSP